MRWKKLGRSSNVDDIRGRRGARRGGPLLRIGGGRSGIVVIVLLVIAYFVGGPELLTQLLGGTGVVTTSDSGPIEPNSPGGANPSVSDEAGQFVAAVLASTEDEWQQLFAATGKTYSEPRLTLFSDAVQSACGYTTSAAGPFYCPPDRRVYLDTSFFSDLARMGGPGDFAQAYVIGHEVGHHVQNLLGAADSVRQAQRQSDEATANQLQVAMELQADCYAGVWAHHANRSVALLEPGDVEEGLAAAAAIGDDRLLRNAGRRVTPDSFTHGSSVQRQQWLQTGLRSGNPQDCDTFSRM